MDIQQIAKSLQQDEGLSPGQLSSHRAWLGGEYALLNGQLADILALKPAIWMELRNQCKSDTAAERAWQRTEAGQRETKLRLTLKSIEKLMSAVKTRIEILLGESRSQF